MLRKQVSDLVRIFILSVILSVGYGMNFVSMVQALVGGKQKPTIWALTYAVASIWLFTLCIGTVSVTLFGLMIKFLYTHKYNILAVSLFVFGVFLNAISVVFAVWDDPNNKYICWELETLYTLLPIYLACLIYFFNDERLSPIKNLTIFSSILFITPFIRLLVLLQFFQFPLTKPRPFQLISSYFSVCFGIAMLTSIHMTFQAAHYNSGLFIKLCIIASLTYYIIVLLRNRIDFNKYSDQYRIYYHYVLIISLYLLYVWHIFIKGRKKVVEVDMEHIRSSPSFDINVETMEMNDVFEGADKPAVSSILELASKSSIRSSVPSTMSPSKSPRSPSIFNNSQSKSPSPLNDSQYTEVYITNPNETIDSVIKAFPDFKPCRANRNKYFDEINVSNEIMQLNLKVKNSSHARRESGRVGHKGIDRLTDSICAIVPFYNEKASEIHATLRSLYFNFEYIKKKDSKYKFTHFNVLLVGDGWFKADISTQRYLSKLYSGCRRFKGDNIRDSLNIFTRKKHKHNTIILQTKHNRKLCINPFENDEKRLFLKVTTVIKIDNRKKANSHEWFLGRYGFAEWCRCDYMFFTDAYSTLNKEGLYQMMSHMKLPKNSDVVCCTGRARVYSIDQELEFQNLLRQTHVEPVEDSKDDKDLKLKQKSVPYIDAEKEIIGVVIGDAEDNKYDSESGVSHSHNNNNHNHNHNYVWWENGLFKKSDGSDKNIPLFSEDNENIEDNRHDGENIFYSIQDIEFDRRLTVNAHLRSCQTFEFEALYGTIGCYLLGGFLPVIPGPCGFYRSKYLLKDAVRGWYFQKINQQNDPDNIDLVLGNMKLAEDRILTISSILNCPEPVRHSLIPECIFYFDPIPNLTQLMKQRRRWLNGSIATVIFVLRKISFNNWNVNIFRRYYVLSLWYMQLLMYVVVSLSPPLIFIISFKYGLATILDVILIDHGDGKKDSFIKTLVDIFMFLAWFVFLTYIYFMQKDNKKIVKEKELNPKWYKKYLKLLRFRKETIVKLTLLLSYSFGLLTLIGTFMQMVNVIRPDKKIINESTGNIVTNSFNFAVIIIEVTFFVQSFVLAPLVSKDIKTLKLLLETCVNYFMYSPFYVTYFFINALANLHDLSWGTRPDNELEEDDNGGNDPKSTTYKILFTVIFCDLLVAFAIQPFTEYVYAHIIFFSILAFPSLYQIFFTLLWLGQTRLVDLWRCCKPKKMRDAIEYTGLTD